MSKNILKASILVLSLLAGKAVFADHDETGNSWWCGNHITLISNMVKSLNLSNAQAAQVQLIKSQFKATIRPKFARMQELRVKIQQEVQSEPMHPFRLDQLIAQKTQLVGEFMKAKAMAQHQVYIILDPQQKIIYQQKMAKRTAYIGSIYAQCMK